MRHHYFYSECEGVGNIKSLTSSHSFCFIPIRFQRMCGEIIYVVFWTRWSHDIWSRTSRRCANRNRKKHIAILRMLCRTSRRCANRNLANAIILAIQMSHLTRVRESKSNEGWRSSQRLQVAPCTGARIEIWYPSELV